MPTRSKYFFIPCFLFAFFSHVFAQDSTLMGTTINWDLVKCIDYAKKNNIQINTFRLSLLTSQQQYLLAKAARLPNLTGSASQNFTHQNAGSNNSTTGGGG